MTKRRLKPFVVPMMYSIAVVLFITSMYFVQKLAGNTLFKDKNDIEYVDSDITDEVEDNVPVVNTENVIVKPYIAEDVTIGKSFYDYKAESDNQEKAIIYYENTYMQNLGVDYVSEKTFDVVSVLEGTVTKVEDNDILGKTIEIKHSDNVISVYQGLSEITVKENDTITQGQTIAKSGTSNINKDLGNHLHFELYMKSSAVNPEDYYNKSITE